MERKVARTRSADYQYAQIAHEDVGTASCFRSNLYYDFVENSHLIEISSITHFQQYVKRRENKTVIQ